MAWTSIETNKAPWSMYSGGKFDPDPRAKGNAEEIRNLLASYGWSLNAICGVLGNWSWESYLNPGQWQLGHPIGGSTGGFGLGQWTPPKHYIDWANLESHPRTSGYWQVYYLDLNDIYFDGKWWGSQWNNRPSPGWTWEYYKTSQDSPEECANAYFQQWEQPGDDTAPERKEAARYWFTYFEGTGPGPPDPPDPGAGGRFNYWWYARSFIYGGPKRTL